MKRTACLLIFVFMISGFCLSASAFTAGDQEITMTTDVIFVSKYIWRGQNLVDDWCVQPSVDFAFGDTGAALNIWYSKAFDNDFKSADELDVTISKSTTFNDVFTLDLGAIAYVYPELDSSSTTTELFIGMSYDWIVTPSATLYYDIDDGDGGYVYLGLSYSYALADNFSIDPSVSLGYNLGQFDQDRAVNDIIAGVSATYTLDSFYVTVAGSYIFNQEDAINPDDEAVFSVSTGVAI